MDSGESFTPAVPLFSIPTFQTAYGYQGTRCWESDSPAAKAEGLTLRITQLDNSYRTDYIERGLICLEVNTLALWKYLPDPVTKQPCESFNAWLRAYAPWSRSDCYSAMKTAERLKDVPKAKLAVIPRNNLSTLERLSTAVRADDRVLQWASTMPQDDFISRLAAEYPQQHISHRERLVFALEPGAKETVNRAIDKAMQAGCTTREEAIEAICADFLA